MPIDTSVTAYQDNLYLRARIKTMEPIHSVNFIAFRDNRQGLC